MFSGMKADAVSSLKFGQHIYMWDSAFDNLIGQAVESSTGTRDVRNSMNMTMDKVQLQGKLPCCDFQDRKPTIGSGQGGE